MPHDAANSTKEKRVIRWEFRAGSERTHSTHAKPESGMNHPIAGGGAHWLLATMRNRANEIPGHTTGRSAAIITTIYGKSRIQDVVVGAARFELTTPCTQNRCATRLRHAPTRRSLKAKSGWSKFPGAQTAENLRRGVSQSQDQAAASPTEACRSSLPSVIPRRRASPPLISRTNCTPSPPSIPVRSRGTAFS